MPSLESGPGAARRLGRDSGAVTAEVAVVTPVLVLVLWLLLCTVRTAAAGLEVQDAARAAARAASRGESVSVVVQTANRAAPRGSEVDVSSSAGMVRVEVRASVPWLGGWDLGSVGVTGVATAASETSGLW